MHYELKTEDIQQHAHTLVGFHGKFATFFLTSTRNVASHALDYLKGIVLLEPRRNMSRMSAKVTDKNEQSLSHFISSSPWKDEPLIEAIGKDAVELLSGDGISGGLILDESGTPSKGLNLWGGSSSVLRDSWESGQLPFRTKAQLGLERILKAKEREIPFAFGGMDASYGEQPWLLTQLEQSKLVYMADIPCHTKVYLEYPERGIPERRGELWIHFAALRLWRIEDEIPSPQAVWLVIRQILKVALQKKELSFDEAVELIRKKHLNRVRSRNCRLNKQRAWLEEHNVLI